MFIVIAVAFARRRWAVPVFFTTTPESEASRPLDLLLLLLLCVALR